MKKITINEKELLDTDLEDEVIRVKGIIINSKGKVLLAHNNNTFQFPGGHKEKNETLDECIIREIKDETGILLSVHDNPFLNITTYDADYFNTGKKVKNSIFYYRFLSDELPNFDETHYDELELESDFDLFYVDFKDLDSFIEKSVKKREIDVKIAQEMLYVISVYQELYGGDFS